MVVAAIEAGVPQLAEGRRPVDRFQMIIRTRAAADIDSWIIDAGASLIRSFATGIDKDKAAVRAAIVEPWSNGQTEGQITKLKLKLVKRQMYGRANVDLLEARLVGAT